MTDREAMKMAFELLCDAVEPTATQIQADIGMCAQWDVDAIECIDDLRQALAQPEQEPWVSLTIEEIKEMLYGLHGDDRTPMLTLVNVVEAKLKEKNT
jgi:hypothetical protein